MWRSYSETEGLSASDNLVNARAYAATPGVAVCLFQLYILNVGKQIGFSDYFLIFLSL